MEYRFPNTISNFQRLEDIMDEVPMDSSISCIDIQY